MRAEFRRTSGRAGLMRIVLLTLLLGVMFCATTSFAAHPLITDDTGTQGKGKYQLELNGEYEYEKEDDARENAIEVMAALAYGFTDSLDLILEMPYESIRSHESSETLRERGFSDLSVEAKWRFYERKDVSLAIKPGVSFPFGNDKRELGAGKVGYSFLVISTTYLEPWTFHSNMGYIRNENTQGGREDIWHASFASEYEIGDNFRMVGNVGTERTDDPDANLHAIFLLGGFIYSVCDWVDFDAGYKYEFCASKRAHSILSGFTFRF